MFFFSKQWQNIRQGTKIEWNPFCWWMTRIILPLNLLFLVATKVFMHGIWRISLWDRYLDIFGDFRFYLYLKLHQPILLIFHWAIFYRKNKLRRCGRLGSSCASEGSAAKEWVPQTWSSSAVSVGLDIRWVWPFDQDHQNYSLGCAPPVL